MRKFLKIYLDIRKELFNIFKEKVWSINKIFLEQKNHNFSTYFGFFMLSKKIF